VEIKELEKKKTVPAQSMKAYTGSRGLAPFILGATLRPLYSRERSRMFIEFETGWTSGLHWIFGEEKMSFSYPDSNLRLSSP
jgi:hypothetical protein